MLLWLLLQWVGASVQVLLLGEAWCCASGPLCLLGWEGLAWFVHGAGCLDPASWPVCMLWCCCGSCSVQWVGTTLVGSLAGLLVLEACWKASVPWACLVSVTSVSVVEACVVSLARFDGPGSC